MNEHFIHIWLAGACVVAFYFALLSIDEVEGNYRMAVALLFMALIWPVSAAFGAGIMVCKAYRAIKRPVSA